jgi:hypothetical protein
VDSTFLSYIRPEKPYHILFLVLMTPGYNICLKDQVTIMSYYFARAVLYDVSRFSKLPISKNQDKNGDNNIIVVSFIVYDRKEEGGVFEAPRKVPCGEVI